MFRLFHKDCQDFCGSLSQDKAKGNQIKVLGFLPFEWQMNSICLPSLNS